jgi:hypothetical protein
VKENQLDWGEGKKGGGVALGIGVGGDSKGDRVMHVLPGGKSWGNFTKS